MQMYKRDEILDISEINVYHNLCINIIGDKIKAKENQCSTFNSIIELLIKLKMNLIFKA